MLLPLNTFLSIQRYVLPTENVPSRPKQAFLLRLHPDLLDVLKAAIGVGQDSTIAASFVGHSVSRARPFLSYCTPNALHAPLQGLTVDGTCYPSKPLCESAAHDIYLRNVEKGRSTGPLR
jgi:hypothetical protein